MPIPDSIFAFIDAQAARSSVSYDDLRVVVFNGTTSARPSRAISIGNGPSAVCITNRSPGTNPVTSQV
jgi:hypothetical protein